MSAATSDWLLLSERGIRTPCVGLSAQWRTSRRQSKQFKAELVTPPKLAVVARLEPPVGTAEGSEKSRLRCLGRLNFIFARPSEQAKDFG